MGGKALILLYLIQGNPILPPTMLLPEFIVAPAMGKNSENPCKNHHCKDQGGLNREGHLFLINRVQKLGYRFASPQGLGTLFALT